MDNTEILHKEIDLIQGVINRMANNSFLLKGWIVSLIAVIIALTKDSITTTPYLSAILLLPVVAFWYLDAFFQHTEKCYRKLYEWVITNRSKTTEYAYDLKYTRFRKDVNTIFQIMFSKTLLVFYGSIAVVLIVLTFYSIFCK
jgi:hypothetical protein